MAMEAAGYICPNCGHDQAFVQNMVRDENGHIDYTQLVCKRCGGWWTVWS